MKISKPLFAGLWVLVGVLSLPVQSMAQDDLNSQIEKAVAGMPLREIGPALMGGRIADIAIHPSRPSTWYVAAGSGNLWKTTNRGTTWTPIFDNMPSFSIGTVTIDPNNPNVVWVGTGE
ncbi:MAG TPA: glycosyl hydrolase, partial [Cytophagales bacterium]|nr:glycosyl hydrolase [Cytophagales bacterium]